MRVYLKVYWANNQSGKMGACFGFDPVDSETKVDLPGIWVEDCLPTACQNQAYNPKESIAFAQTLPLWFASPNYSEALKKAAAKGTESAPQQVAFEPINLQHFGCIDPHGAIIAATFRDWIRLIATQWTRQPPIGLLWSFAKRGDAPSKLHRTLELYYSPDQAMTKLAQCLLPPECRRGERSVQPDEIAWAMRWLKRNGATGEIYQDPLWWKLNAAELGIRRPDGGLNEEAAKAASAYIWARREQTPDFFALRDHLAPFQTASPKPSFDNSKAKPAAIPIIKRSKRQQKALKNQRKRGRR